MYIYDMLGIVELQPVACRQKIRTCLFLHLFFAIVISAPGAVASKLATMKKILHCLANCTCISCPLVICVLILSTGPISCSHGVLVLANNGIVCTIIIMYI